MEYFLQRIARLLKEEYGNTLDRHCLVFPGRRAGLYLVKYLSSNIDRPVWLPSVLTVSDLFRTYSHLRPAGNEMLLFELYKAYSRINKNPGSFDDFYFWGDMLLNDFDDADKYLVDASKLFINVRDLREIDLKFGEFSDEQKKIISQFWTNVDINRPTDEKLGFVNLWSVMNDLYELFRGSLRSNNLSYEGMVFRDVAECEDQLLIKATHWDMVHFIGFNALNECEKKLMKVLQECGKAKFYWDYDDSYVDESGYNSAGFFMKGNLKMFGNDMPEDFNHILLYNSASKVNRKVIETSSDTAQVKIVRDLIDSIPGLDSENAHQTAVVLADEELLTPLLTSLPAPDLEINITMGYPLRQTIVYSLVSYLTRLQRTAVDGSDGCRFNTECVSGILNHHLIQDLMTEEEFRQAEILTSINSEWIPAGKLAFPGLFSLLFKRSENPAGFTDWLRTILSAVATNKGNKTGEDAKTTVNIRNEFIYRITLCLNRLDSIVSDPEVKFSTATCIKILERLLRNQSVPFSGEPLTGIQIMGILETRALDFRNLIILSMNEGIIPAVSSPSSFIPFSLRQAFGMPSVNHQESIFAYHFYRLLQRAENVIFVYNSNSEGLRSGEMSRFLTQMNFDSKLKPDLNNLTFEIISPEVPAETIERATEHSAMLEKRFIAGANGRMLSPSAVNAWLFCRMKFFFRYVRGIREPAKISGEIDAAMFGSILHGVMFALYSGYTGGMISPEIIKKLAGDDDMLGKVISDTIKKVFRNGEDGYVTGNELIVRDVLRSYIKRILHADLLFAPLGILHLEDSFDFSLNVRINEKDVNLRTGGIIDRIDRVNGRIRIVDYKTGNVASSVCSVSDLFVEDRKKDFDGWLQILLYCEAYLGKAKDKTVMPAIYGIKKKQSTTFESRLILKVEKNEIFVDDYQQVRDQFIPALRETVANIFNPAENFTMTGTAAKCRYCSYRVLCMR